MKKQNFQSQHGFNLVELIIAMALVGIGLAIAIPSYTNLSKTNQVSTQASEFQTALNYARNEAIRLNDNVLFCHSADGLVCSAPPLTGWVGWLIRAAGPNVGAETGPVLRNGEVDVGLLNIKSNDELDNAIFVVRYNPQGLARLFQNNTPVSGKIEVCTTQITGSENLYSVRFNSGGRNEVVKINNSGNCP